MEKLTFGEEVMIGALAREVKDGDWAACGTLSPMPAAALWLAKETHAPGAQVFVAGSSDWPFENLWQGFFDLAQAGRLNVFYLSGAQIDIEEDGTVNIFAAKKEAIERYSLQQFQTRKNEEYRALAHEIDTCKQEIVKLEDRQLDCMEEAEKVQREAVQAAQAAATLKRDVEDQLGKLEVRDRNLSQQLAELESDRDKLADAVEMSALARYERLMKHRGENVIVGVDHGVCGGCHMKLPTQIVVTCRGESELVACPNCGRVLYYTRDMDLAVAE